MSQTTLKKENSGYNYKYTDLAQINGWCESNGIRYAQVIKIIDGQQYIETTYTKDGKEYGPYLGAQVIKAVPGGKVNEAQIYGSGLTYARRYSLLMCFGLATDDDDAECYTQTAPAPKAAPAQKAAPTPKADPAPATFSAELKKMKDDDPQAYEMVINEIKNRGWTKPSDIPAESYDDVRAIYNLAKINGGNPNG